MFFYVVIPKGFFPVQDTGLIQGITEAPPSVSFAAMAERQQALAAAILKDPDVVSLSSFIGVDGTNTTLNSGRFLINLKPRDERSLDASAIIRRLQGEVARRRRHRALHAAGAGPDHRRHGQPHPVPVRAGGRQPGRVHRLGPEADRRGCSRSPSSPTSRPISARTGCRPISSIDRDTAGRFGITPATIDNALYDAFGQRIVSTIFTQSNQYRVILEADPGAAADADLARPDLPAVVAVEHRPGAAVGDRHACSEQTAPLPINHLGQFPAATISFNLAPGASLGAAVDAIKQAETEIGLPASMITSFQGAALAFQAALGNELLLILAAIVTVYIVLGVLYESFIHPVTILSTLPSAGLGALLALMLDGSDLSIIAIIGIILLIGIVKKNAIMMIDFALDRRAQRGQVAARGDLSGLAAALPADPDDDHGGDLRRAAADARHRHRLGAAPSARASRSSAA